MSKDTWEDTWCAVKILMLMLSVVIVVIVLISIPASAWNWYKAGLQRDVYERQGVHMSQWEIFMGAKPAKVVTP